MIIHWPITDTAEAKHRRSLEYWASHGSLSASQQLDALSPRVIVIPPELEQAMRQESRKVIIYNHATRNYAMHLDGDYVGEARTHHEADIGLDKLIDDGK